MNTPAIIVIIAHWIFIVYFSTYIFWGSKKYDLIYLTTFALLCISWVVFKGCIIVSFERRLLNYHSSDQQKYTGIDPSFSFYTGNKYLGLSFAIAMSLAYSVNLFIVLQRNYPISLTILCTVLFGMYMFSYRYRDIRYLLA